MHEVSRQYLIPEYHSCKISGSKILKKDINSKNIMFFFQFFVKYSIHHPPSADTSFNFLATFRDMAFTKFHPLVCQRAVI